MSKNLRRMVTFGLVVTMGILPMSAHSNIVSAQGQEETKTLIMTREDDIDSFDDLDGMTLDLSDKNIVPDADGKVEVDVNDAVTQGNMARNMIHGEFAFWINNLSDFSGMDGVYSANRPIQNIYITNNEIYVTQVYAKNGNSNNVKISRCEIMPQNRKQAVMRDSMNIEGVGHGQNLIPYQYNNNQYFIVCANANKTKIDENTTYWEAGKIGKIEYQPNVTFTSAEIDKLDDTEYSNKTRTPFYDLRRCAVNVSPDGKKMLMFKQSRQGNVQYSFYDFNAIKKALDSNSTNDRSFRYNDKLAEACDSDVINADNVPNGQLQGIAIDNDMNIYIVSDGDGTYNTLANLSVIFKKSKKTIYYSIYGSVSEILYYLGDTISSSEELELEIEGLQIINDKIYMGISPKAENQRNRAFIYYIDNGLIHE